MKYTLMLKSSLLALCLMVAPAVEARTTWSVDGVTGNDGNDCKSPQQACKTIGRALSLALSGDSIMVAPGGWATSTRKYSAGLFSTLTRNNWGCATSHAF